MFGRARRRDEQQHEELITELRHPRGARSAVISAAVAIVALIVAVVAVKIAWDQYRIARDQLTAATDQSRLAARQLTEAKRAVPSPRTTVAVLDSRSLTAVSAPKGASCWTFSIVAARSDAYRCMTDDHLIFDPCFVPSPVGEPLRVLCPRTPDLTTADLLLAHTPPGDLYETDRENRPDPASAATRRPWLLELANGRVCVFTSGGTDQIADERVNYFCDPRGSVLGFAIRTDRTWHAFYREKPGPYREVDVVKVWV